MPEMNIDWQNVSWGGFAIVIVICVIAYIFRDRSISQLKKPADFDATRYAFILNPIKDPSREWMINIGKVFPECIFLKTNKSSFGSAEAREAANAGAEIIVAVGGDGTVREVAGICAEFDCILGVIPTGTANLFARGIGLYGKKANYMQALIDVKTRKVDLAKVRYSIDDEEIEENALVVAGLGLDGKMVKEASQNMKRKLGWFAYYFSASRSMLFKSFSADISLTLESGDAKEIKNADVKSVLCVNGGRTPGIDLIPNTQIDDGLLDVAAIDIKGGLLGWAKFLSKAVMPKSADEHWVKAQKVVVHADEPVYAEIDGELVGQVNEIEVQSIKDALSVIIL